MILYASTSWVILLVFFYIYLELKPWCGSSPDGLANSLMAILGGPNYEQFHMLTDATSFGKPYIGLMVIGKPVQEWHRSFI